MTNNRERKAGEGRGRRQNQFCSNAGLGQGRGRNCNYRSAGASPGSRPQSFVTVLFDGLDRFIERSKKTMALLSSKNDPVRRLTGSSKPILPREKASDASENEPDPTTKQKRITDKT